MGFFRFRRSIKIAPGVRWNLGKKSTSLSFGPRGAHYTIGTAGSRTTVGIPGTGLSYTDIHHSHRKVTRHEDYAKLPIPDAKWIASQHKETTLSYPDRGKDEADIRPDQITELKSLGKIGDESFDLNALGEIQAESLISQLKKQRQVFAKEAAKGYYRDQGYHVPDSVIDHAFDEQQETTEKPVNKLGCLLLALFFMLFIIFLIGVGASK